MTGSDERNRLAVTVFDDPCILWGTVVELLGSGIEVEQMCLVVLGAMVPRFLPKPRPNAGLGEQLTRLHSRLDDWNGTVDGQRIVATSGSMLPMLREWQEMDHAGADDSRSLIKPKTDFASLVREGNIALIVKSSDTVQQLRVTRALLEKSDQRVLTFELGVPVAALGAPAT